MSEPDPKISLIVAVARNGVIGRDGGLPWRLSSDLKLFRRLTMGKPIVMGRRTFQSLPRPLDGRDNIVVSRNADLVLEGALIAPNIAEALDIAHRCAVARGVDEIMIIGGATLYNAVMDKADRIYWTAVDAEPDGDTHFSALDPDQWRETSREALPQTERDEYASTLIIYERR